MAQRANVEDVEGLKRLRAQIVKFAEVVGTAVSDAAADVQATLRWLELEQTLYWRNEQRKRHNELQRALDKLREKQLFKSPTGGQQSYIDEQKYAMKCKARLEEAEAKIKAVQRHKTQLSREAVVFQGALQRLSTISQYKAPQAAVELGNLITSLERYLTLEVSEAGSTAEALVGSVVEVGGAGMGRAGGEAITQGETEQNPALAGIDWEEVRRRAERAWQLFGGPVAVQEGAVVIEGGRVVVFRDALSGRVLVGRPEGDGNVGPAVPGGVCATEEMADLIRRVPGLEATFSQPGDRRAVVMGNEVVWEG